MSDPVTPEPTGAVPTIPPDMLDDLRAQVAADHPIMAIRDVRRRLGCDLLTAKRLVEASFGPLATRLERQPDGSVKVTGPGVAIPSSPQVREVHGVALDDPGLLYAVMHAVNDNDPDAVRCISDQFGLSPLEAEQVLHALQGEGFRLVGCYLDTRGRLRLTVSESEILAETASGFTPPTAPAEPKPALFDGPEASEPHLGFGGTLLTMPSKTHPSGVRRVSLDEIDAVFAVLDQQARQSGEEPETYDRTLAWMVAEIERLDAVESTFLAVNEVCPPSDWLRDLKRALYDVGTLATLRDHAQRTRLAEFEAHGRQATLPFVTVAPDAFGTGWTVTVRPTDTVATYNVDVEAPAPVRNCTTCQHAGIFTCDLFGAMRSEALAWRASNTTGTDCPGWEARTVAAPLPAAQDELRPDWLPDGWTHRLGHYYGPDGEQVFTHGAAHACAWGSRHADVEAWTDWTEYDKRALVLALADPKGTIQSASLRTRAESWLLSDTCTDATLYETGAHDAAMHILSGEGDGPDPRTTLRGKLADAYTTIAGLADLLGERVEVPPEHQSIAELSCAAWLSQRVEQNPAALNFLEDGWTWTTGEGEQIRLVATVQRVEGQTPGEMVGALKAEVAALTTANEAAARRIVVLEEDLSAARHSVRLSPLYTCTGCGEPRIFPADLQDMSDADRTCPKCGHGDYMRHFQDSAVQLVNDLRATADRLQAILDAENGTRGLPGWTWSPADDAWHLPDPARPGQLAARVFGRCAHLIELYGVRGNVNSLTRHRCPNALEGMERVTAKLAQDDVR
jgi:DNA-directed RNA polymerase subunit RPC12/RpoP